MTEADEIMRLLDNGWNIGLFKNAIGSYTAYCVRSKDKNRLGSAYGLPDDLVTDDFTPSAALHRLAEKMLGNIT